MAMECENRIGDKRAGSNARKSIAALRLSPRVFLRLTLASLAIGAVLFAYKAYQPEEYQSEARILLLAPQEQYFPSVVDSASLYKGTDSQTELADKLIRDLKSPQILSTIVDQLHLTEDKSFAASGTLQTLGMMLRVGSFSVSAREAVIDRVQQSLSVERLAPRRVITISMKAPRADAAAKIANSLAEAYIDLLSKKRHQELNVSIDKLNGQIEALSSRLKQTGKSEGEQKANAGDLSSMEQKGRKQMVERLRVRQAELKTLSTLDLLPPAARVLVRATTAYTPVSKAAFLWALFGAATVFLFGLIGSAVFSRFKKNTERGSARLADGADLPQEIRLSFPAPADLPIMPSADIHMVQTRQVANKLDTLSVEQGTGRRAAIIFDLVAEQLSDVTHARIVLMAQDQAWGARGSALANRLVKERSVAYVDLISAQSQAIDGDGPKACGIADLLDGNGSFSDFIDEEWTGKAKCIHAGSRTLNRSDLLSSEFHALLIALEAAYDIVMLDLGTACEDVSILRGFASVPDALAFVIVPEIAESEVAQLHEAVGHLGFADSLIVTDLEFSDSDDNADEPDNLLQAAE
ncbi:Chain length determinant protein [Cohaesibacter marisflavi]|uniref:Chain length determinant protein n=1 Tax=Cohaesibacter marisflavi TaxID=655353 RepID=A0A1I5B2T0_9HYPH|nr:hypothetical protein [Cohaesibacter marisflavi]SFN69026.1 Chain length determinant protein [Cohaesibacter marisflavi]